VVEVIIVRYGEVGIKGGKRREFERKLRDNVLAALRRKGIEGRAKIIRGRILVDAPDEEAQIIAKVPGVVSVSPAREMDYEEIPAYLKDALKGFNPKSFRVETQRLDKTFLKTSMEINREIGAFIVENFGWKVDLKNPELVVGIEIIAGKAYVFLEKLRGVGGLPVGTQGKVVVLLSGGIDSPVAAFLMLKRGAGVIAVHFDQGLNARNVVEKVVDILEDYSPEPIELIVESHFEVLKPYVKALIEASQTVFGENRVQEADDRWGAPEAEGLAGELRLIGPLQTNKAEAALARFDVIETVDRDRLADALARPPTSWASGRAS
jgi:thiamine biosynthesis protein ThiI